MKKILSLLVALAVIVIPMSTALANPMATSSNTAYIYLTPQADGSIAVKEKHYGAIEVGQEFTLPAEAQNVTVNFGELTSETTVTAVASEPVDMDGDGVADEVPPTIDVTYTLPASTEVTYTAQQEGEYMIFMMPQDLGAMTSPDGALAPASQPFAIADVVYNALVTPAPLSIGQEVTVGVSADPNAAASGDTSSEGEVTKTSSSPMSPQHVRLWKESPFGELNPHVVTAVLIVLVAAGVGFYIYVRIKDRKREAAKIEINEEEFMELVETRRIILTKITELESLYEKGEVNEEAYHAKNRAYREQLTKVFLKLKHFTD